MQGVFEKIKERLDKLKTETEIGSHKVMIKEAIEIVDQVADEYGKDINVRSNIVCKLKEFLKEKKKYNSEQADIWRDGADKDAYFREMKDLYMDRANTFGRVLNEIKALEEEYNNGWIPCSKELPKVYEDTKSSDVVLVCGYDEESDYSWQAMGFYVHTEGIKRWFFAECKDTDKPIDWIDIVAWRPLPEPYKP